jgi:hypothetical protein
MAAASRPVAIRKATPVYMGLARAGAALSVVAFAAVVVVTSRGESNSERQSTGDDDSASFESAQPLAGSSKDGSENTSAATAAVPTAALAPASGSGAGASGDSSVVPLGSPSPEPPRAGPPPDARATPPAPSSGSDPGNGVTPSALDLTEDAYYSTPATDIGEAARLAAQGDSDSDSDRAVLLGFGALAVVAVGGLAVLEIMRRRRV